eukprot:6460361-Amphidinium_carterae.1
MACLPKAKEAKTMSAALHDLNCLREAKIAAVCKPPEKDMLLACHEVVSNLVAGRSPDPALAKTSVFMARFLAGLGLFCRCPDPEPSTDGSPKFLVGRKALTCIFEAKKSLFEKDPSALTLSLPLPHVC